MRIVAFFFPWHTAQYANKPRTSLGFPFPSLMLASSVSRKDPLRLMSPPSADGWGKLSMTALDFTDA